MCCNYYQIVYAYLCMNSFVEKKKSQVLYVYMKLKSFYADGDENRHTHTNKISYNVRARLLII